MKWATIIFAGVLVCGCGKLYTEKELRDTVWNECKYARVEASMNCMSCGYSLAHWHNCGGGGFEEDREREAEVEKILDECRARIDAVNRRFAVKINEMQKKSNEDWAKYLEVYKRPYVPEELREAEKVRAMVNEVTARTVGVK